MGIFSLYHKNTQLEDVLHLDESRQSGCRGIQSLEKEAKSRRLLLERYPEGNERRINKEFLEEDYKKCGHRMSAAKVGQIMKTEDHHMYYLSS